jgi:hypothetical protein
MANTTEGWLTGGEYYNEAGHDARHPRQNHTSGDKSPALQLTLCLKLPPHDFPMHSASTPTVAEVGPAAPAEIVCGDSSLSSQSRAHNWR